VSTISYRQCLSGVTDEVVLTQNEFNEYVLDETSFAREARLQNSSYSSLGL
jgi:hypothetical protein